MNDYGWNKAIKTFIKTHKRINGKWVNREPNKLKLFFVKIFNKTNFM